jgi:hypothetical protein
MNVRGVLGSSWLGLLLVAGGCATSSSPDITIITEPPVTHVTLSVVRADGSVGEASTVDAGAFARHRMKVTVDGDDVVAWEVLAATAGYQDARARVPQDGKPEVEVTLALTPVQAPARH